MCAQSHQQRERKICVVHAAEGRCPAALPADATPAPQRPARCQPQLRRLTLGAWRAPGDAAVSAATAACAMAARCAASRQRGRADSSSEYATCTCARGARAASAAPADGREGSCTGCRAPWGARRQPCRACAGCRAATPGRTQSQVRCHSRSLANHNVKKKMSSTACEAGAAARPPAAPPSARGGTGLRGQPPDRQGALQQDRRVTGEVGLVTLVLSVQT